ncbi:hypothetical protein QMK33_23370, partial [Hymenobacter sp. H14-R3]|uniref:hypothetical protein n=1 Tax=Hymenobacter sp. H14-R3 TaxID=3046308 RepID=UPI0024B88545
MNNVFLSAYFTLLTCKALKKPYFCTPKPPKAAHQPASAEGIKISFENKKSKNILKAKSFSYFCTPLQPEAVRQPKRL